jgi:hypothetical protein
MCQWCARAAGDATSVLRLQKERESSSYVCLATTVGGRATSRAPIVVMGIIYLNIYGVSGPQFLSLRLPPPDTRTEGSLVRAVSQGKLTQNSGIDIDDSFFLSLFFKNKYICSTVYF